MIDMSKQYRTRGGREVRIYAVDGDAPYIVHGAVKYPCGWNPASWTATGAYDVDNENFDVTDLIEVKPRIQREVWVNVFEHACAIHDTQDKAAYFDKNGPSHRIACVKLTIDCEEGEGL